MLAAHGYDVRTLNTVDFSLSMRYNPLAYVRTQRDVLELVECLVVNTTPKGKSANDPFWENSERLLYCALVGYLTYHCPPEDRTLPGLMTLLSLAEARDEDESFMSPLDVLNGEHELHQGERRAPREGGFKADDGGLHRGSSEALRAGGPPVPVPLPAGEVAHNEHARQVHGGPVDRRRLRRRGGHGTPRRRRPAHNSQRGPHGHNDRSRRDGLRGRGAAVITPNKHYAELEDSYLFTHIAERVAAYQAAHPKAHLLRMGIGDVTLPLCDAVIAALHQAVDDQASRERFQGYLPNAAPPSCARQSPSTTAAAA